MKRKVLGEDRWTLGSKSSPSKKDFLPSSDFTQACYSGLRVPQSQAKVSPESLRHSEM